MLYKTYVLLYVLLPSANGSYLKTTNLVADEQALRHFK